MYYSILKGRKTFNTSNRVDLLNQIRIILLNSKSKECADASYHNIIHWLRWDDLSFEYVLEFYDHEENIVKIVIQKNYFNAWS